MLEVLFGNSRKYKTLFWLLQGLWLAAIIVSAAINHHYSHQEMEHAAKSEARAMYRRDMDFRRWAASQGGVYIPVTTQTPPSPYLAHIPFRDINRPDGTPLTLVNPSYMIRLINENSTGNGFPSTHMTSLAPLRPENRPDAWEKSALERAERGEEEISEFTTIAGQPYLRYFHAARAETPCLKCHAIQGYRLGDLRGGLVVSLPVGTLLAGHEKIMRTIYLWHSLLYLLGAALLLWGRGFVGRRLKERDQAHAALEESEANFRTIADFAYAWEYWLGPEGETRYVSPSVKALTGFEPQQFRADRDFLLNITTTEDRELIRHHLQESGQNPACALDFRIRTADGEIRWLRHLCRPVYDRHGFFHGRRASNYDITPEKTAQLHNEELIGKLSEALDKVKTLSGFLPICAGCKKIRDDQGYWNQIESYIANHSEAVFSHGICPDCANRLYPGFYPTDKNTGRVSDPTKPEEG